MTNRRASVFRARSVLLAAPALALALSAATPGAAADSSGRVCLNVQDIKNTQNGKDDRSLFFYMRDGKIWKNTLYAPCPGLSYTGFTQVVHNEEICGNAQLIYLFTTQQVCRLGTFETVSKEEAKAAMKH